MVWSTLAWENLKYHIGIDQTGDDIDDDDVDDDDKVMTKMMRDVEDNEDDNNKEPQ